MKDIPIGATGSMTVNVTADTLAERFGSGAVGVFSTPNLVLVMEQAAVEAVRPYLEEGETSVGTLVNIRHISATPPGLVVSAKAVLAEIDRRRLIFQVEAYDGVEKIGEGTHERFVVKKDEFLSKAQVKLTGKTINSVE
jgi:fluoroacetyl-CoA thioesterase